MRETARPVAPSAGVSAATQNRAVTASTARDGPNQAPAGQTATTVDRSLFENRPAFSVGDVLRDSPGVSIKQGNGPRDLGISIRGSNARNTFGVVGVVHFTRQLQLMVEYNKFVDQVRASNTAAYPDKEGDMLSGVLQVRYP